MDSLTQIVLGASMGEAVAGRKIGNRAMLWGAVAGTIPDLDVFGGLFGMSPEANLAFHRGISHSIFFSILAPLLLAAYTHWYYKNNHHKTTHMKYITAISGILFLMFCGMIANFFPYVIFGSISWPTAVVAGVLILFFGYRLISNYAMKEQETVDISYWRWYLLFFVAVFTHPILDSCTGYGTQLFQPFSDYRVAWNNISVADPFYTGPFLVFLILAATRQKSDKLRTIFISIAIGWSILYMGWTVKNKITVDSIFTESLANQEIAYSRCMTTPSILNNVLWHCIAEGDSVYYDGYYSLNDKEPVVEIQEIQKNHHLITNHDDKRVQTIKWFTNNYYNVMVYNKDTLQVNDLRYGAQINGSPDNPKDYIFPFQLTTNGQRYFLEDQSGPPDDGSMSDFWDVLWTRVAGI